MENLPRIRIKTNLKVSQAMPFMECIAELDGLQLMYDKDMTMAYNKFLVLLLICEQNGLNYRNKREFKIALQIYQSSIKNN